MNLQTKTALITGASGGIGAHIAKMFATAGADVLLGYGRNQQGADQVKTIIEQAGGHARLAGFDLRDEKQVETSFAGFDPTPDILINNAGVFTVGEILTMDAAHWDEVQAANLRSAFLCSREAIKRWTATKTQGVIVNIASIAASLSHQHLTHYCAAKAGMVALSRNLAAEFGSNGIRVNTVSPGVVWRDDIETAWPDGVARWKQTAPLGQLVEPDDIANACLFLASDKAAAITGIELVVDAGISVALPF
ncbi:3-oxoacyl-[acyl-carrier protein] reductase [hydrothermal vent metagenome]|uniref:3-oxoacyl-[acyl-carrier protein] reductase n=1 Tax=hydrothermal vent metagenome TaxID=652676 RepID=A0A3B0RHS3_9ZZZZ